MKDKVKKSIKVIDLFAGPGGLGEGFSNCNPQSPFKIAISVEKEAAAHQTLTLRAFYRALKGKEQKNHYYKYIQSQTQKEKKENFKAMIEHCPDAWTKATNETLGQPHALGNENIYNILQDGEIPSSSQKREKTEQQKTISKRIREIKEEARNNNEPIIVIGGPPCQAYSKIGRARQKGNPDYKPDNDQRFFLYDEYAKIIAEAEPDVFVMENVNGIGSAKLLDDSLIFPKIIEKLQYLKKSTQNSKKKYHIYSLVKKQTDGFDFETSIDEKDYLISAVDFGVPQYRERVILLGIKAEHDPNNDLNLTMDEEHREQAPTLAQLIGQLPSIRSSLSSRKIKEIEKSYQRFLPDNDENWHQLYEYSLEKILKLVAGKKGIQKGIKNTLEWYERTEKHKIAQKRLKAKEINNIDLNSIDAQILPKETKELIKAKEPSIKEIIRYCYPEMEKHLEQLKSKTSTRPLSVGNNLFQDCSDTFTDKTREAFSGITEWIGQDMVGITNHQAKQHTPKDLTRYLFNSLWTEVNQNRPGRKNKSASASPETPYIPISLASYHISWFTNDFKDRFRTHPKKGQAKTITSHMHKDGHANIHYDPKQIRSLTVREAARIQSFPDNYYFEGGQSKQYLQVGNAVPPYLAKKIALHVLKVMKQKKIV